MSRWFHGGVRGLHVGQLLLPPSETNVESLGDYARAVGLDRDYAHRQDRVYLAKAVRDAALYAGLYVGADTTTQRGGDVYEAMPIGDVEPDGDYLGEDGGSIQCVRARIVRVVVRGYPRDLAERMLT